MASCTAHIGRWHCHQVVRASFFSNVKYAAPSKAPSVLKGSLWHRLGYANCTRRAQQSPKAAWSSQRSSSSTGSFRSSSNSAFVLGCLAASRSDKSHCNGSPSLSLARLVGGRVAPPFSLRSRRRRKVPHAMLAEPELTEIAQMPEVVDASWELLRVFDKNDARGEPQPSLETEDSRAALRDAVLVASRAAEMNEQASPLLGICASSVADGVRALREWTTALNTTMAMPVSKEDGQADITKIDTPVYIKYNARSLFCYLTQYTGKFRGVIVQLGQQQVGHLPLSLFKAE